MTTTLCGALTVGDGQEICVSVKEVLANLNEQRSRNEFCDVTIIVGDKRINAHRNILAANSKYFHRLLLGGDGKETYVSLEGVDDTTLETLVNYFYNSELLINMDTAENLLVAANLLELEDIKERCLKELEYNLEASNCLWIKDIASTHSCPELERMAMKHILENFTSILMQEQFLLLSFNQLMEIIASDELNVPYEQQVYDAVMTWVRHDEAQRKMHLGQLFTKIRLQLLELDFLTKIVNSENLVRQDSVCCRLIDEARNKVMRQSRCLTKCPEILVKIGNDGQIGVLQGFGISPEKWQRLPFYPHPTKRIYEHAAALRNMLYLTGRDSQGLNHGMVEFDFERQQWTECPPPTLYGGSLAALEEHLYSIGGNNGHWNAFNSLERYDPLARSWKSMASLTESAERLCISVFGGSLYAFVTLENRSASSSANAVGYAVYRYDPKKNRWFYLMNRISTTEEPISVAVHRDHIYILAAKLCRDVRNVGKTTCLGFNTYQFEPITRNFIKIKNPCVLNNEKYATIKLLNINEKLYAIEHSQDVVIDEYNPATDKWILCPTMPNESFNFCHIRHLIAMPQAKGLANLETYGPNCPATYPRYLQSLLRRPRKATESV